MRPRENIPSANRMRKPQASSASMNHRSFTLRFIYPSHFPPRSPAGSTFAPSRKDLFFRKTANTGVNAWNALDAPRKNAIDWKPHLVRHRLLPRSRLPSPRFSFTILSHYRVPAQAPELLANAGTPVERHTCSSQQVSVYDQRTDQAGPDRTDRPISRATIHPVRSRTGCAIRTRTCLPRWDSLSPDISPTDTPNFCRRFCSAFFCRGEARADHMSTETGTPSHRSRSTRILALV